PWAPRDHQSANARVLERHGAALVLPDGECTGERLDELLGEILAGTERLSDMAGAARSLGRSGATSAVADLVEEVALGSLGGGRSLRRGRSLRGGRSLRSRHATGEKVPR
ncbi:MAG: glycosyltransferase, partial [Acidimicrobiales bacterium]